MEAWKKLAEPQLEELKGVAEVAKQIKKWAIGAFAAGLVSRRDCSRGADPVNQGSPFWLTGVPVGYNLPLDKYAVFNR